jgi:type II secretory pathway pseudopilin PulG
MIGLHSKFRKYVGLPRTTLQGTARNHLQSGAGFTLIEVVITMALFTMTVLLAVTLLVVYIQQQRRTIIQEQLQNDARAVMEKIAGDIREGTIDYDYYIATYPLSGGQQKLFSSQDGAVTSLVLRDAFNTRIMYRITIIPNQVLQRCIPVIDPNNCDPTEWQDISPSAMQITNFTFYITPSENAFTQQNPIACKDAEPMTPFTPSDEALCRWGTSCEGFDPVMGVLNGKCAFQRGALANSKCYCVPRSFGGILPLQPRVTFDLSASRTAGGKTVSETFQTTISSRVFQNADKLNRYVP